MREGPVGRPRFVRLGLFRFPFRPGGRGWRHDRARVGSWSLEEPIHHIDLLLWWCAACGGPIEVTARGRLRRDGLAPSFTACLRFADGAVASLAQTLEGFGHYLTVELVGAEGALRSVWSAADALAAPALVRPAEAQAKRISFFSWNLPLYEEKFRGWFADLAKVKPGVEVEWIDKKGTEWAPFYQTQLAAGTPPDVIDVQGILWVEYAANDGLVDLTPYLEREPEVKARFNPEALKFWQFNGRQYMLPYYFSKTLMIYNKKLFAEAGLSGPPADFDQIIDHAYKVAKTGAERSGFITLNFDWLYWALFAMNGVELLTKDLKATAFNTPKATKDPDACWELIKIATSDKWQKVMADTFTILTLNKNLDDALIKGLADPLKAETLRLSLANMDKATGDWVTPLDAKIKDAFWPEIQAALLGQKNPKDALEQADRKVSRLLRRA